MSRLESKPLNMPAGTGAGTDTEVSDWSSLVVQVDTINGASLRIEASHDGTNFYPLIVSGTGGSSNITANGLYRLGGMDAESLFTFKRIRVNRTVAGAGTPAVTAAGRNCRMES